MSRSEITLAEEKNRDNRIVAYWLINYEERKKDYELKRKEIIEASPSTMHEIARNKWTISDPTGRKGQKLAELQETEKWLSFVDEVERRLPWKMQIILRLRREGRFLSGNWVIYAQRRYVEEIAVITGKKEEDVWVSESRIKQFWSKILEYSARLAGKKGLLS